MSALYTRRNAEKLSSCSKVKLNLTHNALDDLHRRNTYARHLSITATVTGSSTYASTVQQTDGCSFQTCSLSTAFGLLMGLLDKSRMLAMPEITLRQCIWTALLKTIYSCVGDRAAVGRLSLFALEHKRPVPPA